MQSLPILACLLTLSVFAPEIHGRELKRCSVKLFDILSVICGTESDAEILQKVAVKCCQEQCGFEEMCQHANLKIDKI
ncbi:INSulin related [Caenorhabditis elegans]|uniref:INSulin related n=1 Tax=Caenorhabditis elegans TaxID=6239 RepID=Q7KX46_CAEEL|nr:INSulin related [Caenorhabditis elegans]CCD73008.1 INSulin related [Caenorhabditis elegans]|eukprot:NP_001022841.1 INSulin related [Caenorhabditis elegans]